MKTIGLIGGMSWESTATYYRLINEETRNRLGGNHSAKLVLFSVDFQEIETYQERGDWEGAADKMSQIAQKLQNAGADAIVLCTNTMHKVAPSIEQNTQIPLLHIADATGAALKKLGVDLVGLLGTNTTMEQPFYRDRLFEKFSIRCLTPEKESRDKIDRIIFEELCQGKILEGSRQFYANEISELVEKGAQAIILGCTEIGLLISEHKDVKLLDTSHIHAMAAVDYMLN